MADEITPPAVNAIELATQLTIAWLNNPNVRTSAEDVPAFLKAIHSTIGELSSGPVATDIEATSEHKPAVPVRSSVKSDFILSLIDGRKLKSLKRHLSMHGLTPKEYRERYGLKPDYPMVAPNYSAQRREVARKLGLGRKPKGDALARPEASTSKAPSKAKPAVSAVGEAPAVPAKRGRPRKVVAPAG